MPYNLKLEQRIDKLTDQLGIFTKKKMFGGVGYLLNGNMVFGIHKESLIIRTSPDKAEECLTNDSIRVFDMTGRPMKGWLLVSDEILGTEEQLLYFLSLAVNYVNALPKK